MFRMRANSSNQKDASADSCQIRRSTPSPITAKVIPIRMTPRSEDRIRIVGWGQEFENTAFSKRKLPPGCTPPDQTPTWPGFRQSATRSAELGAGFHLLLSLCKANWTNTVRRPALYLPRTSSQLIRNGPLISGHGEYANPESACKSDGL